MLEPIERSFLWASVDGPNAHGESHPALHDFGELAEVLWAVFVHDNIFTVLADGDSVLDELAFVILDEVDLNVEVSMSIDGV